MTSAGRVFGPQLPGLVMEGSKYHRLRRWHLRCFMGVTMARDAQARLARPWLWPEASVPEIYYARSRKLGFAKLSPPSSTERVRKRIRSDIICKQRRSSASHSFIWFRISRRSYCVINGSAIRRHAIVCQSFNSPIFLLKLSGSVMLSAPPLGKFKASADS